MKKKCANSLKQWTNEIYFLKLKREKLVEKYNECYQRHMSVGGITYGDDLRIPRNPFKNKMVEHIDRIFAIEKEIKVIDKKLKEYETFKTTLNGKTAEVFVYYYEFKQKSYCIANILNMSARRVYYHINKANEIYKKIN